jgi:hypothetical protein
LFVFLRRLLREPHLQGQIKKKELFHATPGHHPCSPGNHQRLTRVMRDEGGDADPTYKSMETAFLLGSLSCDSLAHG